MIQISGDLDERSMTELAEQIKLDLLSHPDISSVDIWGTRDYEIAIEINEHTLQEYHLTLGQVANIVAASSIDLPGGSVRTENGDIMLRTVGQAYQQADFERIVLKTFPDGTRLLLGDIASIEDGFIDQIGFALFNGKYSIALPIMAMGSQDIIKAAAAAKAYVAERNLTLPDTVSLKVWMDFSWYLDERLGMMVKNLLMGALVVFIVLALFLEIKLAFWVMVGIPICFLGSMAVFGSPWVDGTLNSLSIFAFILVLGIVVDDAIIIGEAAYTEQEEHGHSVNAVILGAQRVATPATFGVLTTIVAFMPTLFIDGMMGVMGEALGFVVIFCLAFSLIESKWILPAHLAHSKPATSRWLLAIDKVQEAVNRRLQAFIKLYYKPLVERCIRNRYLTVAFFLSTLILTVGIMAGGLVRMVWSPDFEGEFIQVDISMTEGTPQKRTLDVMAQVARVIEDIDREYRGDHRGKPVLANLMSLGRNRTTGIMMAELVKTEERTLSTTVVMDMWRERVGEIAGTEALSFSTAGGPGFGPDIEFNLAHNNWESLQAATLELETAFKQYAGLYDIQSNVSAVSDEFHIDILPEAETLGITRYDLGSQVRHAFYGAEAQRIQRDTHEVKVMVRYPKAERRSTGTLESMYIRTPGGDAVPFNSVATLEVKPGFNKTSRIDFQRAVGVSAEADTKFVEPGKVASEIYKTVLPELAEKYPGLEYTVSGMSEQENKMIRSVSIGFTLALFGIYALLAIPTKSYMQPLIIMGVIPFGIIGAVFGHIVTGYAVSMMSLLGIIALSGVVVNDSLIMVDYVNRAVRDGMPRHQAAVRAGMRRFRAIILTSLTTFCGLVPMLLETSPHATSISPMAVSLAFGIVFSTVITLLLVPCLYVILDDLARATGSSPAVAGKKLAATPL